MSKGDTRILKAKRELGALESMRRGATLMHTIFASIMFGCVAGFVVGGVAAYWTAEYIIPQPNWKGFIYGAWIFLATGTAIFGFLKTSLTQFVKNKEGELEKARMSARNQQQEADGT
ncbi:hypothetical protein ACFL2D_00745 [Patescibacteria group bacterium]